MRSRREIGVILFIAGILLLVVAGLAVGPCTGEFATGLGLLGLTSAICGGAIFFNAPRSRPDAAPK